MKTIIQWFASLVILSSSVEAQTNDSGPFSADRPGSATPPDIVQLRKVQLEEGIQYTNMINALAHLENYQFSSVLVRYGMLPYGELRIQTEFDYNVIADSTGKTFEYGLTPVTIGTKIRLLDQKNVIPNISLMFNLILPFTGTCNFRQTNPVPSFYLLMSNDIAGKLNLCYNYGMAWAGSSPVPVHFYAACLDIHLHPKWDAFIEGYGFATSHSTPEFYMDTGLAYRMNDHLQLDFSVTGSATSLSGFYQLNMGVAWRIPGKNKGFTSR